MTNRFIAFLFLALFASTASAQERRSDNRQDHAGQFDFYVLSLSWSPTFCASQSGGKNDQQCSTDKDFRFIVHGLWPQYEKGYPDFCETKEPGRVPQSLGQPLFDIMPSMGLIGHEWRKHGTCSGLGQEEYFAVLRAAREKLKIPPALQRVEQSRRTSPADIEAQLTAANPGLRPDALAVTCAAGQIDEVRICFEKDLSFRACRAIDRAGCRLKNPTLPAIP